jgi:ATP-dependent exoDNAse (exonuclease V) beta subunit
MLEKTNVHARDKNITFHEESHTYNVKGCTDYVSVTTFVHMWFEKFDADKVIEKMMKSAKWKESKYYGKSPKQIKSEWEKNRNEAAALGTQLHKCIENFYNNEPVENTPPEYEMFLRFHQDIVETLGLKPYRTEWFVYDEVVKIAGSIDMVFEDGQGNIYIYDWKRTEELKEDNQYKKGVMPLGHLPDTNYWHYCLQLNLYKYILEKNYDKKVKEMYLVCIHPKNETFIRKEVVGLEKDIELLMKIRGEDIKN